MDELRRIRELAEEVPAPDPRRKAQARDELLQLAEAEQDSAAPVAEPGRRSRLAQLLHTWRRSLLRPAPAAGLATLVLVAVAGTVMLLTGPDPDPSADLAEPDPSSEAPAPEPFPAPDPGAPDEGPGADIELAANCTEPEGRVTVAYPDDWHTPDRGEPGACRFFGEDEVDVDPAIGGGPLAELEVVVAAAPLEEAAAPGHGSTELEREEFTVEGRPALRQRLEATGEGALPEGVLVERLLVDLHGETLVMTVQDEDATTLDERRPLLEEMARTLQVHPEG